MRLKNNPNRQCLSLGEKASNKYSKIIKLNKFLLSFCVARDIIYLYGGLDVRKSNY